MMLVNRFTRSDDGLGERVSALEATVQEGSKNLCAKFQDVKDDITELKANVKDDITELKTEFSAMRDEMAEMKGMLSHKTGMETAVAWVMRVVQFVLGGVILWGLQHLPLDGSGHN